MSVVSLPCAVRRALAGRSQEGLISEVAGIASHFRAAAAADTCRSGTSYGIWCLLVLALVGAVFACGFLAGRRSGPAGHVCIATDGGTAVIYTSAAAAPLALSDQAIPKSSPSRTTVEEVVQFARGRATPELLDVRDGDAAERHLRIRGLRRGAGALA